MTRAARRALGRSAGASAVLEAAAGSASLTRSIALRRALKPSRVTSQGLRLAGVCSADCTITARLIISSQTARRLGIRASGRSVAVGSTRVSLPGAQPSSFAVKVARSARAALSRARSADLTLEVVVNGAGTASRRATRRISLGG